MPPPSTLPPRVEDPRPAVGKGGDFLFAEWQDAAGESGLEFLPHPFFEFAAPLAGWQAQDAATDFAQSDDAGVGFGRRDGPQPLNDAWRGRAPGRLADEIGVEQPAHNFAGRGRSRLRVGGRSVRSDGQACSTSSKLRAGAVSRCHVAASTMTTNGLPCLVTSCGCRPAARAATFENCCFASCSCQIPVRPTSMGLSGIVLRGVRGSWHARCFLCMRRGTFSLPLPPK